MKKARTLILVGMVVFSCFAGWLAQSGARDPQPTTTPAPQASEPAVSQSTAETHAGTVTSRHSMMIGRVELAYTATAGFLQLHDQAGKLQANMFYVSYARDGQPPSARPITFAFNGGPGAASLWLHLGALGPKRVVLADDGKAPAKSLTLVDNEDTWLTFTNLVFIDPVGADTAPSSRESTPSNSSVFKGTSSPWPSSFACTSPGSAGGRPRNSSLVKATAPRGRPGWPAISNTTTRWTSRD